MYSSPFPIFAVAVDLVVLTLRDDRLQVLLVERDAEPFAGHLALPGGFVKADEDLPDAAYRELAEETGVSREDVALEQLRTYGTPGRDPRPERVVSVAWVVLGANLPDARGGSDARAARWVPVADVDPGRLAFDHATILADGVERARAKLEYTSLATAFVGETFTVSELRRVYETVWGTSLDPGNFLRKVTRAPGFLEPADDRREGGRGRPAQLYRAGRTTELQPPIRRD